MAEAAGGAVPGYVDSAFTVRKPAWWDQRGEYVHDRHPQDWAEARRWAEVEWEPVEHPVLAPTPDGRFRVEQADSEATVSGDCALGELRADVVDSHKAVCRSDTGARLAVVDGGRPVIGHDRMGRLVEGLLERDDVVYETAGALDEGRQVWALVHVAEPYEVSGYHTPVLPYLAVLVRHDGGAPLTVLPTTVTVVCWNTWRLAERRADREGRVFRSPMSASPDHVEHQLPTARDLVVGARRATEQWTARAELLHRLPIDEPAEQQWLRAFCHPTDPKRLTDRAMDRREQTAKTIHDILCSPTIEGAGIRGSALGLVAAAGEYLDHYLPGNWETRLARTILRSQPRKGVAERLAIETAGWRTSQFERWYQRQLESTALSGDRARLSRAWQQRVERTSHMPPKSSPPREQTVSHR